MTLSVHGLVKQFERSPTRVLDGVTFDAAPGAITCILGASGAGKSTILGIIAGLVTADAGTVHLGRQHLDPLAPHRRPVTLLMQQPQLFPHLTVLDNAAFGLRVRGASRRTRRDRAQRLLELTGVGHLARRAPQELSGGEQQRVALARALAVEPRVLLADEPFASVDAPVRRELQELLTSLHRNLGTAIVLVTHDLNEALTISDQLVVLNDGHVTDAGPPAALFERPTSAHTARLVGFTNIWTGPLERGHLVLGAHRIPVRGAHTAERHDRATTMWTIRPEHVNLCSHANGLSGVVTSLRYLGSSVEVGIDADGLPISARVAPHCQPALGARIAVELPAQHLIELTATGSPDPTLAANGSQRRAALVGASAQPDRSIDEARAATSTTRP